MSDARIRVMAAVVSRHVGTIEYLVCQRPSHKQHGGLWEFPGGKCEPAETDLEATTRELHEELQVVVTSVSAPLMRVREPGSRYEIVFVPTQISGDPVCVEHEALRWCTLRTLLTLPLAPSDRSFAEWLATR